MEFTWKRSSRGHYLGRTFVVFALLCVAALQTAVGQSFTIKDLGTLPLGFPTTIAFGINNRGQVVGAAATASWIRHAFLFDDGVMTDLGTLPGGSYSDATGINNRGQVVGVASTASGETHAFLFENGAMVDLGTLHGGESGAAGINDRGQVVGTSDSHAFLFENGVMVDLGTLGTVLGADRSFANSINNRGEVVGSASPALQLLDAVLWTSTH